MAGLSGHLYPASETLNDPLIAKPRNLSAESPEESGIEVEETASRYRGSADTEQDALTNSTTRGGKDMDSSMSSSSQSGSTSSNSAIVLSDLLDSPQNQQRRKKKWKDAAVYVSEGEKDAKIFHHPEGFWSKRAFKTLHHPAYYVVHLSLSVCLMLLAIVESPLSLVGIHPTHQDNPILSLHLVVEILLLSFFFMDIFLRFIWFGPRRFITHIRSMFISIVLFVMIIEALTALIRQDSHFRITRALRPILFIDSHYLYGVRRVMRQIFLCIKPITDVLLLILFFVVFFSLLGYYIFSEVDPTFFDSFWRAFVSLFITMTTANNPDVMLEAYFEHHYSPIFFVAYLAITFYFLMNVLLAVVYGSFEEEEKKKFKKLFKHKLGALDKAYDVLTADDSGHGLCFNDFLMFMRYYKPFTPEWQVMCIFKALHKDDPEGQRQYLTRKEFRSLYEVRNLRWKPVHDKNLMMTSSRFQLKFVVKIHKYCNILVKSKVFNIIINLIVLTNLFFLIIFTIVTPGSSQGRYKKLHKVLPASYLFISIYIIEIILRIIGYGPYEYFQKKRNIADFIIILISFICLILETKLSQLIFLAAVRPFKLIRVLRLKRRFSDITTTTIELLPRLTNIALLIIVVYYFFAIIGIECLNGKVYRGCCDNNDTWFEIGSYYSGFYRNNTNDNIPASSDVYYILNFNNILTSFVTLFVLMVVNNWYIIMEGFASEVHASWLVRVYFISFFVVMLVILQVVISFIVDEFKFKVLDTAKKRICPQHDKPFEHCRCKRYQKKVVKIIFQPEDIVELENLRMPVGLDRRNMSYFIRQFRKIKLNQGMHINFVGRRLKTKDDVKLRLFEAEIPEWTSEYEDKREKRHSTAAKTAAIIEAPKMRKVIFEKTKNIVREVGLYFIDWVIE